MTDCIIYSDLISYCIVIFTGEASPLLVSMTRLKSRLSDIIEPDFGLLGQLLRLQVLTRRQYDDVCSERVVVYRSEAVLDQLTSDDQCVQFVKALERTGQQHVVNFITQYGGQKHCQFITQLNFNV